MLKNSENKYGNLTKFLHWTIALSFITQFVLVYWRDYTTKEDPLHLQLILLHKAIGFTLLPLAVLFLIWHIINIKPQAVSNISQRLRKIATGVKHFMFLSMFVMTLTGIFMSMASGRTIVWFGLFEVPNIIAPNKALAGVLHSVHVYFSYAVIAFFVLHVGAALKHHFVLKDNTLRRMLP